MVDILLRKRLWQNHLNLSLTIKKASGSNMKRYLLKQVKCYIDNNLNSAKTNLIDSTKYNFTQPLSVKEILNESEISESDYIKALSMSKDEDLEHYLKIKSKSCFVYNHFDVVLKAWQEKIDIQTVFNEYKAVENMWQYFSEIEDTSHGLLTSHETSGRGKP